MARWHYSAVADRFRHIDSRFMGFELDPSTWNAALRVRLYPWWEHPAYLSAVAAGRPWGFDYDLSEAGVIVTVFATETAGFRLTRTNDIVDWAFLDDHPLLLPFRPTTQIFCNSRLDRETAISVVDRVERSLGGWHSPFRFLSSSTIQGWLELAESGSFSVGHLPDVVAAGVKELLEQRGASMQIVGTKTRASEHKVLLLDGEDYVIAMDFELDVPEVTHRPEYFAPGAEKPG